ncbi:MAG: 2'-5' RNA ligase family protein [Thiomonas sp.]
MLSSASRPSTLRLFFALWPDSAMRDRLCRHQALWSWEPPARPTPESKLHLTLLFMDGVPVDQLGVARELGEAVSREWTDFDLLLDRAAVWRQGGIAHLAPSRIPPCLRDVHATLAAQAARRGLPFDARPYAPHVTLGRRADRLTAPAAFSPLHWPVRDFVLVQSVLGTGRYAVLGRWPSHPSPPRERGGE